MKKLVTLFSLFVSCTQIGFGQVLWNPDTQVNDSICTAVEHQFSPDICSDGSGGSFIVWTDRRHSIINPGGVSAYIQRKDSHGNPIFQPDGINLIHFIYPNAFFEAKIVPDGVGGAIVVAVAKSTTVHRILAQRIDSSGNILWNQVTVIPSTTVPRHHLISDNNFGAYLILEHMNQNGSSIRVSRIDSNGIFLWQDLAVTDYFGTKTTIRPITNRNGDLFISWTVGLGTPNSDIYGRWIDKNGNLLGPANGFPICDEGHNQTRSSVCLAPGNDIYVSWTDYRDTNSIRSTYSQKVLANGSFAWQNNGIQTFDNSSTGQSFQTVSDSTGNLYLIHVGAGGSYIQKVGAQGSIQWPSIGIQFGGTYGYADPTVLNDGSTTYIIGTTQASAFQDNLVGQKVLENGTLEWGPSGVQFANGNSEKEMQKAILSGDGLIVTWRNMTLNHDHDIFATKIHKTGSLIIDPLVTVNGNSVLTDSFCIGDSAHLDGAVQIGVDYQWFLGGVEINGATTNNYTATSSGYYFLRLTTQTDTIHSDSIKLYFDPGQLVNINGVDSSYCDNDSAVLLTGTPSGGTFGGQGIQGNIFDPAAAGLGSKIITYSFTNSLGCNNSDTANTVIYSSPQQPIFCCLDTSYCISTAPVSLTSLPQGGIFSGNGINNNSFSPSQAGPGTHIITYTVANPQCTSTYTDSTTVQQSLQANFSYQSSGALTFNFLDLTGQSTTWEWDFGDNSTSSFQNPSHTYSTQGLYNVCLTVSENNICLDSICQSILVVSRAQPMMSWEISPSINDGSFRITGLSEYQEIQIFNAAGKKAEYLELKENGNRVVRIKSASGVYYIVIDGDSKMVVVH